MNRSKLYSLFIVPILISIVFILSVNIDVLNTELLKRIDNDIIHLTNENIVKVLSFGYPNLLADFYFLSSVQYMGDQVYIRKYTSLPEYIKNIAILDPNFIFNYRVASLIMSDYFLDDAININKYGMYNNHKDWSIPYYLGYLYTFYKDQPSLGASYFDLSATKDNALLSAKRLGAAIRRQNNMYEAALIYWEEILLQSIDKKEIHKANLEIKRITNMKYLNDIVKIYIDKSGKSPDFYMNNLVKEGYIKSLPIDPMKDVGYGWDNEKNNIILTIKEGV